MCYQEEDSTFVHDNNWYNLNTVLQLAEHLPVELVEVGELLWCVEKLTDEEIERADKADLSFPILVTRWGGRLVTVDGFHRLIKAVRCGVTTLPSKYIDEETLRAARMT